MEKQNITKHILLLSESRTRSGPIWKVVQCLILLLEGLLHINLMVITDTFQWFNDNISIVQVIYYPVLKAVAYLPWDLLGETEENHDKFK
jgi:hypothetical protein